MLTWTDSVNGFRYVATHALEGEPTSSPNEQPTGSDGVPLGMIQGADGPPHHSRFPGAGEPGTPGA